METNDYIINETQVLANIIVDANYQEYLQDLTKECFMQRINQELYIKAKSLYEKNQLNVENLLIVYQKSDKYKEIANTLGTYTPLPDKTMEYSVSKIKDNLQRNNLRATLMQSLNELQSEKSINDISSNLIYNVNKLDSEEVKTDLNVNMGIMNLFAEIEEIRLGKIQRYKTEFTMLDKMTAGGLKGGELTVVAGRPGTGKTTFALNIASNIAKTGKNVYFVCLEMSDNQLMSKVLSYESGVNSQIIYSGKWKEDELEKINNATNILSNNYNLTFNTKLRYLEDMLPKFKKLKSQGQIDVLIVDYISLISTKRNNQTIRDKVSQISREFKLLSLELDIPIILLSQLNREAQTREPSIADLRESGSVEQDADNIILLYKDESITNNDDNKPVITCNLAKQRAGMVGKFSLLFNKSTSRFINIAPEK